MKSRTKKNQQPSSIATSATLFQPAPAQLNGCSLAKDFGIVSGMVLVALMMIDTQGRISLLQKISIGIVTVFLTVAFPRAMGSEPHGYKSPR